MDTNTEEPLTWTIPAYRLEEFQKRVAKANRRLEGHATFDFTYEEKLVETVEKESGATVFVPWVIATLDGPLRLSIGDYTFVASLIPEEAGITVHTAPGQSLDGWERPALEDFNRCDHCGLKRHRTRIYIVREDSSGKLVQLGHNCISKYTGLEPKGLWALEFDRELDGFASADEGLGGWSSRDYSSTLASVIGMAWAFSNEGRRYVSRAAAEAGVDTATADDVRAALFFPPRQPTKSHPEVMQAWRKWMRLRDNGFEFAKDEALIADILKVAETLKPGTDYADNMHIIVAGEHVSYRNIGVLASLVKVYARHLELEEERKRAVPAAKGFLGEPGGKLKDVVLTVKTVRQWDTDYGVTTLIVGRTEDQHTVVWRASRGIDINPGDSLHIKSATIKGHDEYKGVDQTVITRARLA